MLDEVSIQRQVKREQIFKPPCCPNSSCSQHLNPVEHFWRKNGARALKRFPYSAQRFQCKSCDRTFGISIFQIYYRQKVWGLNRAIWDYHHLGVSRRECGRRIHHSERLVRTRLRNMARFSELKHAKLTEGLNIEEQIVYDGLENFSFSQYDPNNINHAVGKRSLFIYDFNFCPINRKGRMSPRQKNKKLKLEKKFGGPYPRDAIRNATRRVFERLLGRTKGELTIYSDRHYLYRKVVEEDLKNSKICHIKVSSKIHRNFRNALFAVNNIDLQARHNLSAFKRETIAFSKHEIAMQDSFLLYATYRNYLRPKFWGTHRSDPLSSKKSPAMELGLTNQILSFDDFFSNRIFPSQIKLNEDAQLRYHRQENSSRRKIAFAPIF